MTRERKRQLKLFTRSALITAVVLACISAVFLSMCECYEQIRRISFGEEVSAVFIGRDHIRVFDFVINF